MRAPVSSRHLFDARCRACWFLLGVAALIATSFWSLDLQWKGFVSAEAFHGMLNFVREFFPPDVSATFLAKVWNAGIETLAMSLLGTLLAMAMGLAIALPASSVQRPEEGSPMHWARGPSRLLLNVLRSIPELVWAALLLISAGLGPFAGTLALAFHTTGVLGRLFAEAIENAPPGPAFALRAQGISGTRIFLYATLPQVLPQVLSYTLYRWENNIRAAAVLGVVGAGGLGQLLSFHMGLFHMHKTATILGAMIGLVVLVDLASYLCRRWLNR
ncbi:MAG: phosphonate ABC transporter, permease protein PhnE [Betaproteobacteria bacterium]|nr:phosphonate ABC transporter, permease protein PhnE [Betaproteobacteria bacterium]